MVDFSSLKKQQSQQNQQNQQSQQQNGKTRRPILYPNTGSISIVLSAPKKGKYGYLVLAKPIYGTYYDGKTKKSYAVRELKSDTIYLKIKDEELAGILQRGLVLIWNPSKAKKLLTYNAPEDGKQQSDK